MAIVRNVDVDRIVQNHVRVVKDIMILRLGVLFVKSFSARYLIHVKRSKCI
jgi:hypothetical protein